MNYLSLAALATMAACLLAARPVVLAGDAPANGSHTPGEEAERARRELRVAPGLKVDLFAAEPDLANPVSLCFDRFGRCFVVETTRRRASMLDVRDNVDWLDADFSFRTVSDRVAWMQATLVATNKAMTERLLRTQGRGGEFDLNHDGLIDWRDFQVQSERIRLLIDTDNDGRADQATIFADGFNSIVSGVAAGVLARPGAVYFTCIPDLWKLEVSAEEGVISRKRKDNEFPAVTSLPSNPPRTALLSGFGVHMGYGGHDMHGLILGPDGLLYWSMADRGTDTNLFARLVSPWPGLTPELLADSGCIFRCKPDGRDLEVVAWGLRNPQELVFDEFGNLFTADNNADGGDKARWHYVVDGADFGWRVGWQWLPRLGAWNKERLWHLAANNTAAASIPPLAHIGHGPAGLTYYPGSGLPAGFAQHFFLCDFPGSVLMWTNRPVGASFEIGPVQNFVEEMGPADVAFGPAGGVYVADWLKSFDPSGKGRVYRVHDPATDNSSLVQETRRLLAEGMKDRSIKELAGLLEHADVRVRLEAQYQLAIQASPKQLATVLAHAQSRLGRLHALWALTQYDSSLRQSRSLGEAHTGLSAISGLLDDTDAELRAQAAHVYGEVVFALFAPAATESVQLDAKGKKRAHWLSDSNRSEQELVAAAQRLIPLLKDPSPRVRLQAGLALARLGRSEAIPELASALREAGGERYVRHALVLALARTGDAIALRRAATLGAVVNPAGALAAKGVPVSTVNFAGRDQSSPAAVRMGVVLALGRLGSPSVAEYLADPDPLVALEAARAIHDANILEAMPALADWVVSTGTNEMSFAADKLSGAASSQDPITSKEALLFLSRRALNANFRLGLAEQARALARFAARPAAEASLRIEALEMLADWDQPAGRDKVTGLWRPLPARDPRPAAAALRSVLPSITTSAPEEVRLAATRAGTKLGVGELDPFGLVTDREQPADVRVEALRGLVEKKDPRQAEAIKLALADREEKLRVEAARLQAKVSQNEAVTRARQILQSGSMAEKQATFSGLSGTKAEGSDALILEQLDLLLAGKLAKELELDLLETAGSRGSNTAIKAKLASYESALPKDDALAPFRQALFGGNAAEGRKLFVENQQVACFRCHKVGGEGGEVGPELTGLGTKKPREYILESIVLPNRQVAAGFESVTVTLKNGMSYAGLIKTETDSELTLNSPEDGILQLKKADVQSRQRGLSPMPEELAKVLTRRDLRNIIEFLATLK